MPRRTLLSIVLLVFSLGWCNTWLSRQMMVYANPAADTPRYTVFLPAVLTSGSMLTTDQLIEQDQANGTITGETALVYKVYAAFGDTRLPAQYHGTDPADADSFAPAQAAEQYDQLSPETQAILAPFLIPPAYQGSWLAPTRINAQSLPTLQDDPHQQCVNISADWHYTEDTTFRIWWIASQSSLDATTASTLLGALERTISPKLTGLMQQQPLSDAASACNGGDGHFDIYLMPQGGGVTMPFGECQHTPAYILLPDHTSVETLAHEFMHAIQWSYPLANGCLDDTYHWLAEATAQWAKDYVYPDSHKSHAAAYTFLDRPEVSLETDDASQHEYGDYLLPFFLQPTHGPDVVRQMWVASETCDSVCAVNSVLHGGFTQQWPLFALANWNRPPLDDYKKRDTQLTIGAKPAFEQDVALHGTSDALYSLPTSIPHLASKYYHFTFSDSQARTVTFYNGLGFQLNRGLYGNGSDQSETLLWQPVSDDQKKGLKIQALVKIDNQWQTAQDWTAQPYHDFCRDSHAERIQELLIVISNSEWQDTNYQLQPQALEPTVRVTNAPCWQVSGTSQQSFTGDGVRSVTEASSVVFQRDGLQPQQTDDGASYLPPSTFHLIAGSVTRDHTLTAVQCTYHWQGSASLTQNDNRSTIEINAYDTGGQHYREYHAYGANTSKIQLATSGTGCVDIGPEDIGEWLSTNYSNLLDATGSTLNGTFASDGVNNQWQFSAVAEP